MKAWDAGSSVNVMGGHGHHSIDARTCATM